MYCGSSNSTSMLRAAVGFKSGKEMEISPFSSVFFAGKLDFCCIMGIVLLLIFDV